MSKSKKEAPKAQFNNVCTVDKLLEEKLTKLANAERITKAMLGELSRDLLAHYRENYDPALINRLLGVYEHEGKETFLLTPANWKHAVDYFRAFIPRTSNWEDVSDYITKGKGTREAFAFDKFSKARAKAIEKACESEKSKVVPLDEWLKNEANDIWVWVDMSKVEDSSETDYLDKVLKAIEAAQKKGVEDADLVYGIMKHIDLKSVLSRMDGNKA